MKCRRICRELLWFTRFGELGPSSKPHLEHLAECRSCRDEVGFDRAMVDQLRAALAARIAHAAPSPTAWERIRAQAQVPEPRPAARLLAWTNGLVGRLRFATAMTGTGLALLLALNTQIVPVGVPATTGPVNEVVSLQQVPRVLPGSTSSAITTANVATSGVPPDPESMLNAEDARHVVGATGSSVAPPVRGTPATDIRLVVRVMQTPDPGRDRIVSVEKEPRPQPLETTPGAPS